MEHKTSFPRRQVMGIARSPDTRIDDIWVAHRAYLVDLAFRMLGRIQDAEDAVQEAFTRLLSGDIERIDDKRGWLTVVVSRICLDQLRSAKVRQKGDAGSLDDERPLVVLPSTDDPADRVTLDDSVRLALLVVLEELNPPERAVFVLHDVFGFSFDSVAGIVGRSPGACRQIAARARRRIEKATAPARFRPNTGQQNEVVRQFIAACAGSDITMLMHVLDPDVVGVVDLGPTTRARRPLVGAQQVAAGAVAFFGTATGNTLVSQPVNGETGALAFHNDKLIAILRFKTRNGTIIDIHSTVDPDKLAFAASQLASIAGR
jgi:RNA polymerase sigma-70 factor (ECF subfamily)